MEEEVTTADVAMPPTNSPTSGKSWRLFNVGPDVIKRFATGRNQFERWSKFLDVNNEAEAEIYNYVKKYPKNAVVLRCNETGILRSIRKRAMNE